MKERPILFSAPMVRAILAGTKTQTRRVVKPVGDDDGFVLQDYGDGWWPYRSDDGESTMKNGMEIPHACPYGQPGDRLWVREAWADCDKLVRYYATDDVHPLRKKRPSIHMPRWASRITLEITSVQVEHLQDISVADCIAEGIPRGGPENPDNIERREYQTLWESINGAGSWNANPWVWVVAFKRMEGSAA